MLSFQSNCEAFHPCLKASWVFMGTSWQRRSARPASASHLFSGPHCSIKRLCVALTRQPGDNSCLARWLSPRHIARAGLHSHQPRNTRCKMLPVLLIAGGTTPRGGRFPKARAVIHSCYDGCYNSGVTGHSCLNLPWTIFMLFLILDDGIRRGGSVGVTRDITPPLSPFSYSTLLSRLCTAPSQRERRQAKGNCRINMCYCQD